METECTLKRNANDIYNLLYMSDMKWNVRRKRVPINYKIS